MKLYPEVTLAMSSKSVLYCRITWFEKQPFLTIISLSTTAAKASLIAVHLVLMMMMMLTSKSVTVRFQVWKQGSSWMFDK